MNNTYFKISCFLQSKFHFESICRIIRVISEGDEREPHGLLLLLKFYVFSRPLITISYPSAHPIIHLHVNFSAMITGRIISLISGRNIRRSSTVVGGTGKFDAKVFDQTPLDNSVIL